MKDGRTRQPEQRADTIKAHHIEEHRHDPYRARGKLHEPTQCTSCSAVFVDGRWQWIEPPRGANVVTCPACRRIADDYPAGELTLTGAFVTSHGEEIVGLIRNTEEREKSEHPLQRLIRIDEKSGRMVVTTTDIHLPRRIAHALEAAYKGQLKTHYDEAGYFVRIAWHRDA